MKILKKIISSIIVVCLFLNVLSNIPVVSANAQLDDVFGNYNYDDYFMSIDDEGNVTHTLYSELETYDNEEILNLDELEYDVIKYVGEEKEVISKSVDKEVALEEYESLSSTPMLITEKGEVSYDLEVSTTSSSIEYGVVVFGPTSSDSSTVNFTNFETGVSGYLHPNSAPEAVYLGTVDGKIKFKQSGVVGLCSATDASVISYDSFIASGKKTNYFSITGGKIKYNMTVNLTSHGIGNTFGYQESYMVNNASYYSYDGHYFYSNYKTMIDDYKVGVYTNSINPTTPYYNYYQYLSHRTNSIHSSTNLTNYINSKSSVTTSSKMYNIGGYLTSAQSAYGVNANLIMSVAANESGWGTSSIAQTKNNLFGHNAYDSDPTYSSNSYANVGESINAHAKIFVSNWYSNSNDWKYFGSHFGDKQSGMNVKYASDPYWGLKAASMSYILDEYFSTKYYSNDQATISITNGNTYIYQEANTSTVITSTGNGSGSIASKTGTLDVPLMILGSVQGAEINGNSTWYKVKTDTPLNSSRTAVDGYGTYNHNRDYGYIHSSAATVVNGTVKDLGSDDNNSYILIGDVNQDGKVSTLDYVLIRNHIMSVSTLTGDSLSSADVNQDGKISTLDYVLIRNDIMGISSLN